MNKHFLLGAGLALVVTFTASSVFAQSLMSCASLGGKMVTDQECDIADSASGVKPTMMSPACVSGQLSTPQMPCTPPQSGQQQNFQPAGQQFQQFNQQQFGFPQQQQTPSKIITPTIKSSGITLASKGLKLTLKMQSSLNSKYSRAKGKTKKLAAVRSIAKKLPTLCRYISSGDDEADLDESAFDCDAFVAELLEPIGDALKVKDYEVAYESTIAALESFGQVFESLQQ